MSVFATGLLDGHIELRARAMALLGGGDAGSAQAVVALKMLHELANSPATADKALGLLHELQVHQVELDLQNEELRRTNAELEKAYARQLQLYHEAPVAYATLTRDSTIREVNRRAEQLLGLTRQQLIARPLDSLLLPISRAALCKLLGRLAPGQVDPSQVEVHQLIGGDQLKRLRIDAILDPDGEHVLLTIACVQADMR